MRLGIVVGLAAEARIARGLGGAVVVGGGGAEGAARAVASLLAQGCDALLSFGYAGGLDPALAPGALLVPRCVLVAGTRIPADAALTRALGGANHDVILGASEALGSASSKHRAHQSTGASGVDLESAAVVAAGLPFAVLRAVCDPAARALPAIALTALDTGGRPRVLPLLRALARHPGDLPPLLALTRDAAAASRTLRDAVRRIGRIGSPAGGGQPRDPA